MLPQIKPAGIRLTMAHSESQAFKQGQTTVAHKQRNAREIKDVLENGLSCFKVRWISFTRVMKTFQPFSFVSDKMFNTQGPTLRADTGSGTPQRGTAPSRWWIGMRSALNVHISIFPKCFRCLTLKGVECKIWGLYFQSKATS